MRKVLIVEDDIFISAIFSFFIRDLGHCLVGRCQTGEKALEHCANEKPDVVLMDIHLDTEMDGIQTAERIQRDFDVPVIFISSDTSSNVVERAKISNSYGYLVKPVKKNELGISIELAYYKHKLTQEQKSREQGYRSYLAELPAPVIIVQGGLVRYLNMNALDMFRTHYMEDIIGLPLLKFVEANSRDVVASFINGFNENPVHGKRLDVTMTTVHGEPFEVALMAAIVQFAGKNALQVILHDITFEREAIKRCQLLHEALIQGCAPVLILDEKLEVKEFNVAFQQLVDTTTLVRGTPAGQIIGDSNAGISMLEDFARSDSSSSTLPLFFGGKNYQVKVFLIGSRGGGNFEVLLLAC